MSSAAGFFVCVEGPSGVGKSTLIAALVTDFNANGVAAIAVKQPSRGPMGELAREMTDTAHGLSLACLVAADRYHQLDTEIRPALAEGTLVVCDRYLPSSLVLQCADGVDASWVLRLNEHITHPNAYIFLSGMPSTNRRRSSRRGERDRFHSEMTEADETDRYRDVAQEMSVRGHHVLKVDVQGRTAHEVLAMVRAELDPLVTQHYGAPSV